MLNEKNALITGASRGIGKAIALAFAKNGANIAVIYAGNREKAEETCREAEAFGVKALPFCCDVSDFAAAKETVAAVTKALGPIDILVNNAGITRDGLIYSMKEEAFDAVIDTNLKGAFHMIKHCTPGFLKRRSGRILNISSISGLIGNAGQANYSASKAGLIGLTKSVAREFAPRGICCNAIAPGFIATEMTENIGPENPLIGKIPLGRVGTPEDVAALAVFLAGDTAGYITGEVIRVDGGLAI